MKTLGSSCVLLFVFIVSTIILLDSSNHSSKSVSDKYEEISVTLGFENPLFSFSKRNIKIQSVKTCAFCLEIKNFNLPISISFVDFVSKIKSYLHLLQLP